MEKFFFGCFIIYALSTGFYAWKSQYYWARLIRYTVKEHPELLKELGLELSYLSPFSNILAQYRVLSKRTTFEYPEMSLLVDKCRHNSRMAMLIFLIGGSLFVLTLLIFG